ncbi:MAG TPA: hypothetical protein PLD88_03110, partial [Candidatus Berkiella sp.]|nr:hypothetical protein [Candidatus Berkiella sp.]
STYQKWSNSVEKKPSYTSLTSMQEKKCDNEHLLQKNFLPQQKTTMKKATHHKVAKNPANKKTKIKQASRV